MNKSGNTSSNAPFEIHYHPDVLKIDLPHLERSELQRVKRAIEQKILVDPLLFGLPLRNTLKNYRKLRVGNWRIVYTIVGKTIRILIIAPKRRI